MTHEQLETVRMLTNHDLDSRSPLTILLIGQPTLRRRLRVGDMAALDQRVQLRYHIPAPPLSQQEASGYIRRHLEHAGRSDTLFSDDAVRAIRRRRPRHPRPRPRPAPGHQPARDHRAPGSMRRRQDHRRRILRPHRHHRGGRRRDRLTTTTTPRPPQAPPGSCRAGLFTPRHRHAERRHHGHPERRRTPARPVWPIPRSPAPWTPPAAPPSRTPATRPKPVMTGEHQPRRRPRSGPS